jgi:large subunit ribosomal protein L17
MESFMRHRVHGRKLGRTSSHRKALFRNQLTALFTHERIITTVAKAKELRPIAERMVTLARTGTLAARRKVAVMVPDNEIAKRLFEDIAPRFADRPGGYTRIMRLGRRRGDNAELAIIEFVDYELSEHEGGGGEQSKGSLLDRAKGVFGGGAAAAAGADDPEQLDAAAEESATPTDETTPEKAVQADESPAEELEPAVADGATDAGGGAEAAETTDTGNPDDADETVEPEEGDKPSS